MNISGVCSWRQLWQSSDQQSSSGGRAENWPQSSLADALTHVLVRGGGAGPDSEHQLHQDQHHPVLWEAGGANHDHDAGGHWEPDLWPHCSRSWGIGWYYKVIVYYNYDFYNNYKIGAFCMPELGIKKNWILLLPPNNLYNYIIIIN